MRRRKTARCRRLAAGCLLLAGLGGMAHGQPPAPAAQNPFARPSSSAMTERTLGQWLERMHEAARRVNYVGTFVVSSASGMSSARITHACNGDQQIERIEALSGAPRYTYRRGDEVITFWPDAKRARAERRDTFGLFPGQPSPPSPRLASYYEARQTGIERVAGHEADVVLLQPRDTLRYGYRLWLERKSGLLIKVQTLDGEGRVLEQSAFSELQLNAPLKIDKLAQAMSQTGGWRVERLDASGSGAEGWRLAQPVAGYQSLPCRRRVVGSAEGGDLSVVHCVYTDGIASVSLFLEPGDAAQAASRPQGSYSAGATQSLRVRLADGWLTAVGEVPQATLRAFAQALERSRP